MIVFPLTKLSKAKFSILCDVKIPVKLQEKFEIDHSNNPRSLEWSIQKISYSLTIHIASHSMENLAFHSLLTVERLLCNQFSLPHMGGGEGLFVHEIGILVKTGHVQNVHSPKLSKEKCMGEVVRIGSVIIFHLSKLWKAKFSLLCDVIFLERLQGNLEIDHPWDWKG